MKTTYPGYKTLKRSTKNALVLSLMFLLLFPYSWSQPDTIRDNTNLTVNFIGNHLDYVIDSSLTDNFILVNIKGGDGGTAKITGSNTKKARGGEGAIANAYFKIGTGINEIPAGSFIRFIVGQKGKSRTGNTEQAGSGGGGTGVAYSTDNRDSWKLLIVAGAGGGGYRSDFNDRPGQGGRKGTSGGDVANGGKGGNNGQGGKNGDVGAGGGGWLSDGEKSSTCNDGGGKSAGARKKEPTGGNGGCDPSFGFGFGGGGHGNSGSGDHGGGGGGGYSGGGGGDENFKGGGGGSFVNDTLSNRYEIIEGDNVSSASDGYINAKSITSMIPVAHCNASLNYHIAAGQTISISPSDVDNGSSDDNTDMSLSLSKTTFTCADMGSQTVTLTVTDITNQTANCTATITLTNAAPTAACQSITINLPSSGGTYTVDPSEIDDNSLDPEGFTMKYNLSIDEFDCNDYGTRTNVTLTIVDDGNFADTCSATVTVGDNTSYLTADNSDHPIFANGSYKDFKIPETTPYNDIEFFLGGADGGTSKYSFAGTGCTAQGGKGAIVQALFKLGTGENEIPKGSIIRFVAGEKGSSVTHSGFEGAGGGGGTAVLYRHIDSCDWTLLAVAGGGGGGGQNFLCEGENGRPGDVSESGSDGKGGGSGGGSNGNGGNSRHDEAGGGGGHLSKGEDISDSGCTNQGGGEVGFPEGGSGGKNTGCASSGRKGGFGYGGGGAGEGGGGGGGGYSGGGAGGEQAGGGGGGSFVLEHAKFEEFTTTGTTRNPSDGGIKYKVFTNDFPIALCKTAISVSIEEEATLSTSDIDDGSHDPDGSSITLELISTQLTCDSLGSRTFTLIVTDNTGLKDTCTSSVTVSQTSLTALTDDGTEKELSFTGDYEDFSIPVGTTYGQVKLTAWGGDGGRRKVNAALYNCSAKGGKGAKMSATFEIGCGVNQIPPGSKIRFVVGKKGKSLNSLGFEAAGGGGGSGVMYREMGSCDWTLLLVAGGGGGAYAGGDCIGKSSGKEARKTRGGAGGKGSSSGGGGSNGNGGNVNVNFGGAGGGHLTNGEQINCGGGSNWGGGKKGFFKGGDGGKDGAGGCGGGRDGGYGYGGGGLGDASGGGGGGFSGGGAGGSGGGGGGGGSYISTLMAIDSTRDERGTTNDPDNGKIRYQFLSSRTAESGPTANCKNITVALDANGTVDVLPADLNDGSTLGSCGNTLIYSFNGSDFLSFACSNLAASQSVTLTVADEVSRTSTCNASVTVTDTSAPILTCPATQEFNVDPVNCTAVASLTAPTFSDNCASTGQNLTQKYKLVDGSNTSLGNWSALSSSSNLTLGVGRYLVAWAAEDGIGNTGICQHIVTVKGSTASVSCKKITVQLDANGFATIAASELDNGSSSTCSNIISESVSPNTFDCSNLGSNFVTRTAVSSTGDEGICTAVVIVQEDQAPQALCQPASLQLDAEGVISLATSQVDNGSYDACGTVTLSLSEESFDCSHIGSQTVTLTATDEEGISSQCTASINIVDVIAPAARCQPASLNLDAFGEVQVEVLDIENNADDACGIASLVVSPNSFDCSQTGTQTVILTVTDNSGNTSQCSSTVTVTDVDAPTISCPADMNLSTDQGQCSSVVTYTAPTGQDNCTSNTVLTSGQGNGETFSIGSSTEVYTVTDASGQSASCSFSVTINDTELPVPSCPTNINQSNETDKCEAIVNYTVSHSDNCSSSIAQTDLTGLTAGDYFPVGSTTLTYTATDAAGNTADCSFSITITDDQAPIISCPSHITAGNDQDACDALISFSVTASDNCSGESISQTAGIATGGTFPVGTTQNSFTVTGVANNTASCSFSVTVEDRQAPVINCPVNINSNNDLGLCGRQVTYITPQGTDNCTPTTIRTGGQGSGTFFSIGTTTETYQVSDAAGNTADCSFSITINDDEDPVISILGDNPKILCEGDVYVEAGASANDNCDSNVGQSISINNSAVNTAQEGNYQVIYAVTDVYGNSFQTVRTIIVKHTPAQLAPQNCGSCSQIRFDFCEGEDTPDLEQLLTANSNYELGINFLWYADNSNTQGNPINRPTVNTANKNNRFYWVSQMLNGCEGEARSMRVRVRKTSIVVMDLPAIGCNTGQIDLAAWVSDSRNIASSFIFYDADPTLGANPVGSVSASNGQVNSGQYAVVSLQAGAVTYYAVATNNTGCQVTGSDEVISSAGASLNPISNLTVNSGDLVHVTFNSPDATHILWINHSSFNNPYVGLLGSGGLGDLLFTARNIGSSPQTAMLRAIAYNGNCAGDVRDFYITVLPGTQNRQIPNSLQLTASKINAHDVQLDWQINYEFELTSIEIEKQKNDGDWETIGHQAVGSHYNVTQSGRSDHNLTLYDGVYLDRGGMGNETKYRLKLIHADGRAIWSQEIEVNFDFYDSKRFTLYPNPTNCRFSLRAAGELQGEWRYKLSDQMGRTILIGKLNGSETAFDISHLPTAHYFLLIISPEGKQYLQRVVKN